MSIHKANPMNLLWLMRPARRSALSLQGQLLIVAGLAWAVRSKAVVIFWLDAGNLLKGFQKSLSTCTFATSLKILAPSQLARQSGRHEVFNRDAILPS